MELPVLTRRDRLASGVPAQRIDNDIRSGRVEVPYRGVHVIAGHVELHRIAAALRTQAPGAVLSHRSAAVRHRLRWAPEAWRAPGATVDVIVAPGDKHRQRTGLLLRQAALNAVDVTSADGVPVTSVARTLVDLARSGLVAWPLAVALMDGALQQRLVDADELRGALDRLGAARGVQAARAAVAAARPGVESPPETELRLAMTCSGIPEAWIDIGIEIRDDVGAVMARSDLGCAALMLWGEYDGLAVHTGENAFSTDRRGDRWLERRGWHVLRFANADRARPASVAAEWLTAMQAAPARILAMDPSRSPELRAAQAWLRSHPDAVRNLRSLRLCDPRAALAGGRRRSRAGRR